jgi:hypothetical protein
MTRTDSRVAVVRATSFAGVPRKGDVLHSDADIGLGRQFLGREPKASLEERCKTIEWYRAKNQRVLFASRDWHGVELNRSGRAACSFSLIPG